MYKDLRLKKTFAHPGTESSLQKLCMEFARKSLYKHNLPQLVHHTKNEGFKSKQSAMRDKLEGVLSGVPDIFLPLGAGEYCGLYVELKKGGGVLAEPQKYFLEAVSNEGYLAVVINEFGVFKNVFEDYLELRKNK